MHLTFRISSTYIYTHTKHWRHNIFNISKVTNIHAKGQRSVSLKNRLGTIRRTEAIVVHPMLMQSVIRIKQDKRTNICMPDEGTFFLLEVLHYKTQHSCSQSVLLLITTEIQCRLMIHANNVSLIRVTMTSKVSQDVWPFHSQWQYWSRQLFPANKKFHCPIRITAYRHLRW